MATIDVEPILMKNSVLSFGADDFAAAVSAATLTPTTPLVTWKGLKPTSQFTFPGTSTWVLDLSYAQDFAESTRLAAYLFEHQGETVAGVFEPDDGGTSWAVSLIIAPGAIGGTVDTVPEGTVQLGVNGQPVPTYPA